MTTTVIDSDQHLYETRTMWADLMDPADRDGALALTDDELGYTWLTWRGARLGLGDVHLPGDTESCGRLRQAREAGRPAPYNYDEALPVAYWDPSARVRWLDEAGLDAAVCFPNYGLLWERKLSSDLRSLLANMGAWNRWCEAIARERAGRVLPVGHVTLRDGPWLESQLAALAAAGVRAAMIAPGPVDGRALSHPDHERSWSAFEDTGITPVFHVADQPRVLGDCWYTDETAFVPVIESAFLWVPPAVALSDLILNGVLDRHPLLRVGVVELSSIWVPQFLLMIDGASDFTTRLSGRPLAELELRPSEYFEQRVRISSFSYEAPRRLTTKSGDLFMFCSDYPHSEGTATPVADYAAAGCTAANEAGLFRDNVSFLLGL